jgi:hypothetical protein
MDSVEILYVGGTMDLITEPIIQEVSMDINQVNNRIFMLRDGLAIDEHVVKAQNNGAVAVLSISPTYYKAGYLKFRFNNRENLNRINIPVFELAVLEGRVILAMYSNNSIANVSLIPSEKEINPWAEVFASAYYYIWTVFLGVFPAVNIGLAIWKLKVFTYFYGGCRSSIAIYVLVIELAANCLRIMNIIDALCANSVYPEQFSVASTRLSLPFALSSFLLIILYWHEMMTSATIVVHPFVVKMRIPFFVLSAALMVVQLVQIFLRGYTAVENLILITGVTYIVVSAGIVIFHIITGIKLLRRLHMSKNLGRVVKLRKSTVKILISASFLFMFIIFAAMFSTSIAFYPVSYVCVWYSTYTALNAASMLNILSFEQLPGSSSKSSHGSGSLNTTSRPNSSALTESKKTASLV